MGKWFKCSSCFYDIFFIYTIIVNKELNVFVHLILCKKSCFSDCYPPLILECVAGMFVVSKVSKNMWCKLFYSLRKKLNDDENYYYYYDTMKRMGTMVVTAMMMMMLIMMMMNCDSCCLTVPLTTLLTGAQVKNDTKKEIKKIIIKQNKKKNEKSLNKSPRAAWPSIVCLGPVWHDVVFHHCLICSFR